MRITYDSHADAIAVELAPGALGARVLTVNPHTQLDVDRSGRLIGLKVLDASRHYPDLRAPDGSPLPNDPCAGVSTDRLSTLAQRLDDAYHLAGALATELPDGDPDVVRLLDLLSAVTSELERMAEAIADR